MFVLFSQKYKSQFSSFFFGQITHRDTRIDKVQDETLIA